MIHTTPELQADRCTSLVKLLRSPSSYVAGAYREGLVSVAEQSESVTVLRPIKNLLVTLVFGKQIDETELTAVPFANYRTLDDTKSFLTHDEMLAQISRSHNELELDGYWSLAVYPAQKKFTAAAVEASHDPVIIGRHRSAARAFSSLVPSLVLNCKLVVEPKGPHWVANAGDVLNPGAVNLASRHRPHLGRNFSGWW